MPDYAATLRTQEDDANDANVSFLRSLSGTYAEGSSRASNARIVVTATAEVVSSPGAEDIGRTRRGFGLRGIRRRYTPAQLQELGIQQEASLPTQRPSERAWGSESSDGDDDWDLTVSNPSILSGNARSERARYRSTRVDLPNLPPSSPPLSESLSSLRSFRDAGAARPLNAGESLWGNTALLQSSAPVRSRRQDVGAAEPLNANDSSLRTTALLQSLRQRSQLSSRPTTRLPHYLLERENTSDSSDAPGRPGQMTSSRPNTTSSIHSQQWQSRSNAPPMVQHFSLNDQLQDQRRRQYSHWQAQQQAQQQVLQQQQSAQQAQRQVQRQGQLQAMHRAQYLAHEQRWQQVVPPEARARQPQQARRQTAYVLTDQIQTQQAAQRRQMIALHREWVDQGRHPNRLEIYQQRYVENPSPNPPNPTRSLDDAIKYLGRLCICESEYERFLSAKAGGFKQEEYLANTDFILDTSIIEPPPESSWLMIGAVFSGSQQAASGSIATGYRSFPSPTNDLSAEIRSTRNAILSLIGADPARMETFTQIPHSSAGETTQRRYEGDERWPVKVTIHSIDYDTMTLSGTMEAFNVPDKTSPTRQSSISTFLEGEILDFNRYTLETKSFKANAHVDGTYWRELAPFKNLAEEEIVKALVSKRWLTEELSKKWILMRWKGVGHSNGVVWHTADLIQKNALSLQQTHSHLWPSVGFTTCL